MISKAYRPEGSVAGGVHVKEEPESFSGNRVSLLILSRYAGAKLTVNGQNRLQVCGRAILEVDGNGTLGSGPLQLNGLAGLDVEGRVGEVGFGIDDGGQGGDEECGELHGDQGFEIDY